jgi:hypothetical protein
MNSMHYIGFDIHKKVISFCEKLMDGTIVDQGVIHATRKSLNNWVAERTTTMDRGNGAYTVYRMDL